MYARVVTVEYQPGKWDEKIYREAMVPEAKQQSGFKGAMLLVDHTIHKCVSITLWQTEAEAHATGVGSAHLQAQAARVASILAAGPTTETFEVVFQE
ncbi:MAG TPA: hypothetical protein VGF67_29710 [Ktedonobacteraceae bacterium]|jgi:heme-degrading monooxygenase HmoA